MLRQLKRMRVSINYFKMCFEMSWALGKAWPMQKVKAYKMMPRVRRPRIR